MESSKQSQNAIGRELGLSSAQMTKLKKQGMPVHLGLEACRHWRRERLNIAKRKPDPEQMATLAMLPSGTPASDESHDQARTRREIAEANLAELKLRELRGELVRLAEVKANHSRLLVSLRETFMQFPARVVPMLVAVSEAAAMDRVLRDEIATALRLVAEAD